MSQTSVGDGIPGPSLQRQEGRDGAFREQTSRSERKEESQGTLVSDSLSVGCIPGWCLRRPESDTC